MILGAAAFAALVLIAVFGPWIAAQEPIHFVVDYGRHIRPFDPGVLYPLGSDLLGRDLVSLILTGARATLAIVLITGVSRVIAGLVIAGSGALWRPLRLLTDSVAELASAVPATLLALILIRAFAPRSVDVVTLVAALLVLGWAGPYRVIRAEADRLAVAPFTEGARVLGVRPWRLLWRHQLPHLMPALATNLSQQVVASLVLVAELGVLGVLVGSTRYIDVSESVELVRVGPQMAALVPEIPEWGSMLASSRTVEALWVTRWLIFVPGLAFALTAMAVATIGFALARRYARRDVVQDTRGGLAVGLLTVALVLGSGLLPERYAAAADWADAARRELRSDADLETAFRDAGLETRAVVDESLAIVPTGPATVTVGGSTASELYPRPSRPERDQIQVRSLVTSWSGGGVVEAPVVFAARGIVPSDHPQTTSRFRPGQPSAPALGNLIKDYPDDYLGIDVRGKIVVLVRFVGVDARTSPVSVSVVVPGPGSDESIRDAIRRGAAAVIFVDGRLGSYWPSVGAQGMRGAWTGARPDPYQIFEVDSPATRTSGVPVVVVGGIAARDLLAPAGVDLGGLLDPDPSGIRWDRSLSRDLGVTARIEVPLAERRSDATSLVAEVRGAPEAAGRVVVWAERRRTALGGAEPDPAQADVLAATARALADRRVPFILVDYDPRSDISAVQRSLDHRRIALVIYIGPLEGGQLRFRTMNGDLIPAFDLYADKAGANRHVTTTTATPTNLGVIRPFINVKTVVIGSDGVGDARADASAVIGYAAGRLALGAPELPR